MRAVRIAHVAMSSSLVFLPWIAWAQSTTSGTIAGVVKDTTGAVLPGVTVEAASPALIEKVRTVVTDDQGQYKIVDLRPGIYTVTFTLTGFSTVKREGIELTTGFTAPVNAELKVGSLEETITVSGQSPVVDTQNTRQQKVLTREVIESVPTNNGIQGFAAILPGAVLSGVNRGIDVGGVMSDSSITFSYHGSDPRDMRTTVDGMPVGTMYVSGGGTSRHYVYNPQGAEEMNIQTGATAEGETGGPLINMVPRGGGNTFKGIFEIVGSNHSLQGNNFTDDLTARGLQNAATALDYTYALRGGLGGPIKKDRLWFYTSQGRWAAKQFVAGNYFNKTAGTLFYQKDLSRQAYLYYPAREHGLRLTWQAAKHKITGFFSLEDGGCSCFFGADAGTMRPEATYDIWFGPLRLSQGTWTYPVTSRLLFEAGASYLSNVGVHRNTTASALTDHSVTDLSDGFTYGSRAQAPGGAGLYGTYGYVPFNDNNNYGTRFAMSYVTGSHAVKIGGSTRSGRLVVNNRLAFDEAYTFGNQVPVSLTQFVSPFHSEARMKMDLGLYAQDQWTVKKLTLNLGVRFSYFNTYAPELVQPAGKYQPQAITFPNVGVLSWKDVAPRLGGSYDMFGNGKTAVKVALGRYVAMEGTGISMPASPAGGRLAAATLQ
jgi:carboxypeptidase family protein